MTPRGYAKYLTGACLVAAIYGLAGASLAAAEPGRGLVLVASSSFASSVFDGLPVSDSALAEIRGRGANVNILFAEAPGVVLWDEAGRRKGGIAPVSAVSGGTGNLQSNAIQHR